MAEPSSPDHDPERTADLSRPGRQSSAPLRASGAAAKTPAPGREEVAPAELSPSTLGGIRPEGEEAPPDPLLNTVLGKCQIMRRIGEGGMGMVYQGKHLTLDIDVAVKVLAPALAQRDRNFVERFLREARTAARVHHPSIVQVLDVDFQRGYYFLVMEFVEGETAGDRLRRARMLTEREVVEIGLEAASALEFARRKHVIHRDIKPENILISAEGEVKLADLGLAKRLAGEGGSGLTLGDQVIGTPFYISPEQATNAKKADHRSDLYSLGATLFHLATGRVPFEGTSAFDTMMRHMNEPPPELRAFRAELSMELAAIVRQLLQKDPTRRFQTAGQLMLALRPLYERLVPQDERDALLAGSVELKPDGAQRPPSTKAARLQVSSVTLMGSARSAGGQLEQWAPAPASATPRSAPALPPMHEARVPAPRLGALPGLRGKSGIRTPAPAPHELGPAFEDPADRRPSRAWLLLLFVPFLNVLAYLWIGTVAKKKEWWYWGMGVLVFQSLFLLIGDGSGMFRLGFLLTYVVALANGIRIRREVDARMLEQSGDDDG
ncbi:MAG: protein kinase [Planctomycetota bacterium]|nr:protein kinase [Planctomycetota bacterium]